MENRWAPPSPSLSDLMAPATFTAISASLPRNTGCPIVGVLLPSLDRSQTWAAGCRAAAGRNSCPCPSLVTERSARPSQHSLAAEQARPLGAKCGLARVPNWQLVMGWASLARILGGKGLSMPLTIRFKIPFLAAPSCHVSQKIKGPSWHFHPPPSPDTPWWALGRSPTSQLEP